MRVVALEEHFALPDLVRRIDPQAIRQRGFPPPDAPWSPANRTEQLAQLGAERLQAMDSGGVSLQVLSLAGPGADLLPAHEGPDWAREANDALAAAVAQHPGRFAGFAHLPLTAPNAAADELERAVRELGFRVA